MVQVGLALGRALVRPRAILMAWPVLMRWSVAIALVASLLVRAWAEPFLAQWVERALPQNLLFLGVLMLVFPVVALATGMVSVCGGALGGRLATDSSRRAELTRVGIRGIWLTLGGLLLVAATMDAVFGMDVPGFLSIVLSFPWVMDRTGHLVARQADPATAEVFDRFLKRVLVWRCPSWAGGRRLDVRPLGLSLIAFGMATSMDALGGLGPLQATMLTGLVQVQNAFHHLPRPFLGGVRPPQLNASRRIVMVYWDPESMRQVHTDSSEPRVQAATIRKLAGWDALRVILQPPTLKAVDLPESRVTPDVGEDDAKRAKADLPALVEAVKESGRVVVQSPEGLMRLAVQEFFRVTDWAKEKEGFNLDPEAPNVTEAELAPLRKAAKEEGAGWLASMRISSLPCIPISGRTNAAGSVPWILHRAVSGETNEPAWEPGRRAFRLGGHRLTTVDQDRILVDLQRATPGHDFTRVTYSSILRGEPVFTGTGTGTNAWQAPEIFFPGKLVFLEPVVPGLRATALGEMPRTELLGYATQTLLDGQPFERALKVWHLTLSLLIAVAIGLASARSTLLAGSWRLLVAMTGLAALTLWRALDDVWIDPVLPGTSGLLAFLLVTQWTAMLDRLARDRNRGMLQRFVAPEIVAEMLDHRDGRAELGGQREEVAVLFADVRGFTQFAEAHEPEEVMRVVNAYLSAMTDALNQHGGLLDKYTGDGLMALFRLGGTGPEGLLDAVRAAVAMRDAVLRLSEDRDAGGHMSLRVGISLHVGEAVLGLVGNPTRQINYTALGHTVVVAARLQAVAGGGEVVITGDVADRVGNRFSLEERAPVKAKGITHPLRVYCVRSEAGS
jgi:class 3 adenylate cyclase